MHTPRLLTLLLAVFVTAFSSAYAQSSATEGSALDDFSNYQLDDIITSHTANPGWRTRGLSPDRQAQIVAVDDKYVLGFAKQKVALFDNPAAFSIPADSSGSLSFRIRLPAEGSKENDAFYFILKTREQADTNLTNPTNGLLLLQFSYAEANKAYRFRLEGASSSPTRAMLAPDVWHHVTVRVNCALAHYQVFHTTQAGAGPELVTNHLYKNGVIPFKIIDTGPAEIIYLRNHSISGQVEIDNLRFTPAAR